MKIITISREFGSGGRELGKRLADLLDFDYYDREIITAIAKKHGMDEGFVEKALENDSWRAFPLTFRSSFAVSSTQFIRTDLLLEQKNVLEGIANAGKDCVIVGRNADILLQSKNPFNIFVCADMDTKVRRCAERADSSEALSKKELEAHIRRIDKSRMHTRDMLSGSKWGDRSAYHLIINTTDWNIKELTPAVANFAKCWFRKEI